VQHPDSDDLALIALGEDLGEAVADHVDSCATCQAEIEAFSMTVGLAELANYGEDAPRPGEHVWLAIAHELGFTGSTSTMTMVGSDDAASAPPAAVDFTDAGAIRSPVNSGNGGDGKHGHNGGGPALRAVPGTGGDLSTDRPAPAPGPKRWSRWVAPLAAVVVGVAIGAGAVVIAQNRADTVTIEAVAPLTPVDTGPLAGEPGVQFGQAELVTVATGNQVRVDAPDLPPSGNAYEVWLFGDEGRMVSLGTLSDGTGTFTVPQGINPQEYRVVDVSDEAPDGNPAHSGISLVRGAFS
jgi:hypothetical protein